ncbi:VOC family protein [Candidatus Woesearchaeota archaeon]|nr:VOC family protein [Candidatus Woesearchaeota archaeon]
MQIKELGHVVLYVTDIDKVGNFYKDILGFNQIARQPGMAAFSGGRTHHELLLIEVGGKAVHKSTQPGLYHIGFKIGDTDQELKEAIQNLKEKNVTIVGTADHWVTHSLYVLDPDGNELELYVDINDGWKKDPSMVMKPTRHLNI